jgi:MFS family permease
MSVSSDNPRRDGSSMVSRLEANIWKNYVLGVLVGFAFFYQELPALYYLSFELGFREIGIVVASMMLARLVFEIPSGALADLWGRKATTLLSMLFLLAGTVFFALSSSFWPFVLGSFFIGLFRAFASGALDALIYDSLKALSRETEYLKITAREEALFLAVGIASAYLGPLTFSYGIRIPYFISAVAALLCVLMTSTLYEPESTGRARIRLKTHYTQIRESCRYVLARGELVWLIAFSVLASIAGEVMGHLIDAPYIIEIGFSVQQFGLIVLVGTIMQTAFTSVADRVEGRLREARSFVLIIVTLTSTLVAIFFTRSYLIAPVFGVFWAVLSYQEVILHNYVTRQSKKENRATVISIYSMSLSLSALGSMLLFGWIIDLTSLSTAILFLAAVTLISGVVLLIVKIRMRSHRSGGN